VATADLDFQKTLATLGWDFAGVGLGFYVSAVLVSDSYLARMQGNDHEQQNEVLLLSFIGLIVFYIPIVYIRFCLLEAWSTLPRSRSYLYGAMNMVVGISMMAATSNLAIRVAPEKTFCPAGCVPEKPLERINK
jgi:hypothetical protein